MALKRHESRAVQHQDHGRMRSSTNIGVCIPRGYIQRETRDCPGVGLDQRGAVTLTSPNPCRTHGFSQEPPKEQLLESYCGNGPPLSASYLTSYTATTI